MSRCSFSELLQSHIPGLVPDVSSFDPEAAALDLGSLRRKIVRGLLDLIAADGKDPTAAADAPACSARASPNRIYESILESGLSDSRAANVSPSAVSRWKREDFIFAEFLDSARAKFELAQAWTHRGTRRRHE